MSNPLAQLTDAYEPEADAGLPVANPYRRIPVYKSEPEDKVEKTEPSTLSQNIDKILNALFRDDDQRLQLWPEKVVREGLSAAHDAMTGELPQWAIDPKTGDVHTSPQMVEKAQSMSALAGTGGLGGVTDATLGATPFLRPALKYKDRLYKGKEGQQHMDVIPEALYPEFQRMAMSGEDISHYNFGFVNDKGHFLDREKALKYAIDTGLVDKFAGQYGALTSTLMADSTKPGMAIEAMGKSNPFFSAVEHNVAKIPQSKMTGDQWLGTLSNKPGVKPEELDWTGLKSFLEENKGKPVSKQQIEEHLAANKVELKEVVKGTGELHKAAKEFNAEAGPKPIDLPGRKGQLYADEIEQGLWDGSLTPKDLPINLQAPAEKMLSLRFQQEQPTKYHSYQLPGGENYREMLLTLPGTKWKQEGSYAVSPNGVKHEMRSPKDALDLIEAKNKNVSTEYNSSHWDEPNILAHVRMNDRDVGGKKSLHLEEIQSDWHQQGRDKGYKGLSSEEKVRKASLDKKPMNEWSEKDTDWYNSVVNDRAQYGVPDAPFKKNWHELALKRMIREASEKGYDRLSWTPGEAQAARYDLSKQVDKIAVPMVSNSGTTRSVRIDGKDGTSYKMMVDANGKVEGVLSASQFTGKKLDEVVGKELADKIMKLDKPHDFEGEGLKIGGEGMKGFYDQIIPKALEKLGKEHGVKVKQGDIKIQSLDDVDLNTYNQPYATLSPLQERVVKSKMSDSDKVHYIDIPQSLKDTALHKGFPLFSSTHHGFVFTPVDYEPEFK